MPTEPKAMTREVKRKIPKLIEIPVTQEMIDRAIAADSGACVIADAINAAIPGARADVDLQLTAVSFPDEGLRVAYLSSAGTQKTLIEFDQGLPVEPCMVYLIRREAVQVRGMRQPRVGADGKRTKQDIRSLPEDQIERVSQPGRGRAMVDIGGGKLVPANSTALPPEGTLSNRRGRKRVYGAKVLKPNMTREERIAFDAANADPTP